MRTVRVFMAVLAVIALMFVTAPTTSAAITVDGHSVLAPQSGAAVSSGDQQLAVAPSTNATATIELVDTASPPTAMSRGFALQSTALVGGQVLVSSTTVAHRLIMGATEVAVTDQPAPPLRC